MIPDETSYTEIAVDDRFDWIDAVHIGAIIVAAAACLVLIACTATVFFLVGYDLAFGVDWSVKQFMQTAVGVGVMSLVVTVLFGAVVGMTE